MNRWVGGRLALDRSSGRVGPEDHVKCNVVLMMWCATTGADRDALEAGPGLYDASTVIEAPTSKRANQARFETLDGLRAVAFLSVFGYHFGLPVRPVLAWGGVGYRIVPNLDLGVEIFFVLSGFLIFRPFAAANLVGAPRPNLRSYFLRRALRIYPAYWVAFFGLLALGEIQMHGGLRDYLAHLLLVHTYLPERLQTLFDGLGPSWSLVVEVSFYVVVPILAWMLRRAKLVGHVVVLSSLTVSGFVVRYVTIAHPGSGWVKSFLGVLPKAFAALAPGMLLAVASLYPAAKLRRVARPLWIWWGFACVGIAMLMRFAHTSVAASLRDERRFPGVEEWHTIVTPLVAVCLVLPCVLMAHDGALRGIRRLLGSPGFVWLGTVSFGAYLWHQPLLLDTPGDHFALRQSVMARHGVGYALVVGGWVLGVTLLFAALSWYCIERPTQRFARTLTTRK